MLYIKKKKNTLKSNFNFISFFGNMDIFFIDNIINISHNIQIKKNYNENNIFLINNKNNNILSLNLIDEIFIYKNKNKLIFTVYILKLYKKNNILNLYNKLLKNILIGLNFRFKKILLLQGVGFKAFINERVLDLKLGFSHNIHIKIPDSIQIINKTNKLIFYSSNLNFLTQFVNYIRNFKKPECYKGKGLLLLNETIQKKEGKTGKK